MLQLPDCNAPGHARALRAGDLADGFALRDADALPVVAGGLVHAEIAERDDCAHSLSPSRSLRPGISSLSGRWFFGFGMPAKTRCIGTYSASRARSMYSSCFFMPLPRVGSAAACRSPP